MAQLHMYVPDPVVEQIRKRAEEQGMSISRYLADLVQREFPIGWPEEFFTSVVGGWSGELERPAQGQLETREPL
ncbi:MAG: hypothetical protein RBU45_20965 [Myxococcota bacterium]|jgi:hypothetical protein|nr:hypothetical protein [Myxococcota bacterium]